MSRLTYLGDLLLDFMRGMGFELDDKREIRKFARMTLTLEERAVMAIWEAERILAAELVNVTRELKELARVEKRLRMNLMMYRESKAMELASGPVSQDEIDAVEKAVQTQTLRASELIDTFDS